MPPEAIRTGKMLSVENIYPIRVNRLYLPYAEMVFQQISSQGAGYRPRDHQIARTATNVNRFLIFRNGASKNR